MAVSPRTRIELYFSSRFGGAPDGLVFMPGRLVLLGEHVDHQGGAVLAMPIRQGVYVAWGLRPDRRVDLHALNARGADRFELETLVRSGRRWADLARGACAVLGAEGRRLPGVNLAVYGDLPTEVGLASSAAFTTAVLSAVLAPSGETLPAARAAHLVATVEREWTGVACGLMDPYVILSGEPGTVVRLDTRTLTHEFLPLPEGVRLEPVDPGHRRRLADTPYNQRRRELAHALSEIRTLEPEVQGLVDLTPERFAALEQGLSEPGRRRARHVVREVERVRRAVEALGTGNGAALGALMDECHVSLRDDYECSLPAIDAEVERVRGEPGVLGARLQGAGWGGALAVLRRDA